MLRLAVVLSACILQLVCSQSCYYPNGNQVSQEPVGPCSTTEDSICCPLNWQCLSNNLCYNPTAHIIGRYSCTDKSWGSPCPDFCTQSKSAINSISDSKSKHSQARDRLEETRQFLNAPMGNIVATVTDPSIAVINLIPSSSPSIMAP
jgi:hypothetical protein